MIRKQRRTIPEEKLFVVKRNSKKIDFRKKYKFIYFDWWFQLLDLPFIIIAWFLSALSAIYFGLRVNGWKHKKILRRQGCIVVSNHCHYFDTVFAGFLILPRRLYIMIAQRNFEVPIVRRILRLVRGFPVPAGLHGFEMVTKPIAEALRRGHHVLFLPEQELVYLSQEIFRFKSGAFRTAYMQQVPILPITVVLTRRRIFGRLQSRHWPRIRLVFGEPILPPPLRADGSFPKEEIRRIMDKVADWMEETIAYYHSKELQQIDPGESYKKAS